MTSLLLSLATLSLTSIAATAIPTCGFAQEETGLAAAHRIAKALRDRDTADDAVLLLRQGRGALTQLERDRVADTITAFAIASTIHEPISARQKAAAWALLRAGSATGSGVPYRGAAVRLLRIAEQDAEVAAVAITGMFLLPDTTVVVSNLRRVAMSQTRFAFAAVEALARHGPRGLSALRQLYGANLVKQEYARQVLQSLATHHRW